MFAMHRHQKPGTSALVEAMDVRSNQRRECPTANEYEGHSAITFPGHPILDPSFHT
jgi:hypothetical protein